MSLSSDDRLLWLTVVLGFAAACLYIPATLERVRTLTEVHGDRDDVKQLSNDAEAALKPDVLQVLADGPSYELRASAIKIVATRALKDDTRKILLRDLASKRADTRVKAINVISMMLFTRLMPVDHPMTAVAAFCDLAGFTAVIDALVNCLPLHNLAAEPNRLRKPTQVPAYGTGPVSPLLPLNRPADEKRLMDILYALLSYDQMTENSGSVPLQAGIVKRWLSKYPFPCAQSSNSHFGFSRSDVVSLFALGFASWADDDPPMAKIISTLCRDSEASKQLRECGLKASSYREATNYGCGTSGWSELPSRDIIMSNSEDTAGVVGAAWNAHQMRLIFGEDRVNAIDAGRREVPPGEPAQPSVPVWTTEEMRYAFGGERSDPTAPTMREIQALHHEPGGEATQRPVPVWTAEDMRNALGVDRVQPTSNPMPEGEPARPGSSWARHAPERSAEEDNMRRRHREAIVVAERGTPVTRENILQRQNSRVGLMPLSEPAQELLRVFTTEQDRGNGNP
jgi:hypothetical protein